MVVRLVKKSYFVWIILFAVSFLSGCTTASHPQTTSGNNSEMKEISMSDEEIRILCDIYSGEDEIKAGRLYPYQEECLNQIRYAKESLDKKYEQSFSIVSYDPINKINSTGTMRFETENSDDSYDLQLEKISDGYLAKDNYYGFILEPNYDQYVKELLEAELKNDVLVYTNFSSVMGDEITSKTTTEELVEMKDQLSRTTYIFTNLEEGQRTAFETSMKDLLKDNDLYGSYFIYYTETDLSGYSSTKNAKENILPNTPKEDITQFNCFDI